MGSSKNSFWNLLKQDRKINSNSSTSSSGTTNAVTYIRSQDDELYNCEYSDIGCDFKGTKFELEEHKLYQITDHLQLAVEKLRIPSICSNGIYIWHIQNFQQKFEESCKSSDEIYFHSKPFLSSQYGYKLRLKIYLNGQSIGRGNHISLYLNLMKGPYDNILPWPFSQKIILYLLDQSELRQHKIEEICPNFTQEKVRKLFSKPTTDENHCIGNALYISHEEMMKTNFVKDNQLFVQLQLLPVIGS